MGYGLVLTNFVLQDYMITGTVEEAATEIAEAVWMEFRYRMSQLGREEQVIEWE